MAANKSIKFQKALIRYIDLRRKDQSAPYVRLAMRANLSAHVQNSMGWSMGTGQKSGSFLGNIAAVNFILSPAQARLAGMDIAEVDIACHEVKDFTYTERKNKAGDVEGYDVLFTVYSNDPEAELKLGPYYRSIMGNDSQLKIVYTGIGTGAAAEEDSTDESDTPA